MTILRAMFTAIELRSAILSFACAAITACSNTAAGPRGARSDEIPEQVAVGAGATTFGFETSRPRKVLDLPSFRITRWPISLGQYRQCVAAGACAIPKDTACMEPRSGGLPRLGPTYAQDGNDSLPATCVGVAQAQAYCGWVGGALPTIAQWLTASRGREVTRYPWGTALPRCDQRADTSREQGRGQSCVRDGASAFEIAKHPAGASPFGLEDVLLAPGELLATSEQAPVSACGPAVAACVAYGVQSGAIDSVEPLDGVGTEHGERSRQVYSFRCVFTGDSK